MTRRRSRLITLLWAYALGLATMLFVLWGAGALRLGSVSANRAIVAQPPNGHQPVPMLTRRHREVIGPMSDEDRLIHRHLGLPIAGLKLENIEDTFNDTRGGTRRHEASDILAPRGTPVMSIDAGVIQKLFTSRRGGITIYQFDPEQTYCYYYAHLDRYAEGVHEGVVVRRGQVIGYVGTTGNAPASTPHLHLAIFRLGPKKHWWQGTPVDPFPVLVSHFKM